MTAPQYEMIHDDIRLAEVVDDLRQCAAIAIDTEFARFNTYYPIVGLLQFYDGKQCYLVDPLEVDDLTAIIDLLLDEKVIKVFHACSEDIEVFHYALGIIPTPVFDSQIAAAALGVDFSISYQRLVEHCLNLSIPKDETRSDWLQRPLTTSQLDYAALDVIHLLAVYEKQKLMLDVAGKTSWVEEECKRANTDVATNVAPQDSFLRLKGLSRLDQESLYLVREICTWREKVARSNNVPRNRVIDEKSIIDIAQLDYLDAGGLHRHTSMSARQLRQYADDILKVVNDARMVPEEERPELLLQDMAPVSNKQLKSLRQRVNEVAEQRQVSPELLAKRKHLENILRSGESGHGYALPVEMQGWRKSVIGDELIAMLTN